MFITNMICEQENHLWRFKAFNMDWVIQRYYREAKEQFEYTIFCRWYYGLNDEGKFINSHAIRQDLVINKAEFNYPELSSQILSDFELEKALDIVLMDFIEYTQRAMALNNNHQMPNDFDNIPVISKEAADNYWNEGGEHERMGF